MRGTRVLRYVGNREKPEDSLYGVEEIIHSHIKYSILREFRDLAIPIQGLSGIKPLSFDEKSKMPQLVEPVSMPGDDLAGLYARMAAPVWWPAPPFMVEEKEEARPPEPEFEVNMMEPLVGWRSWRISGQLLRSLNHNHQWSPDEAFMAKCRQHKDVPAEHCMCGIYAVTDLDAVPAGTVYGEVYGWGRYVRGEVGWRSEFAYPKCFHLAMSQMPLVEKLRKYHVPIYIETPVQCYSPEEDGYENWTNEENGDRGAAQDSGSGEEA